jgi:hypothetical protein
MHPFQVGQFAQHRTAGLREETAERRRAASAAPGRRALIRHRAGWILIHVGLRLAISSAGAARNTT